MVDELELVAELDVEVLVEEVEVDVVVLEEVVVVLVEVLLVKVLDVEDVSEVEVLVEELVVLLELVALVLEEVVVEEPRTSSQTGRVHEEGISFSITTLMPSFYGVPLNPVDSKRTWIGFFRLQSMELTGIDGHILVVSKICT